MTFKKILPLILPIILLGGTKADVVVNEFMASNTTTGVPNAVAGSFEDWIELKNTGASAVDLGGWHLTDTHTNPNLWTFPANTTILPGGYLVVFASSQNQPDANGNLHTNFKLSKGGEFVGLARPDGTIESSFGPGEALYPAQNDDISYGLHPSSSASVFFSTPTPGSQNSSAGIAKVAPLQVTPKRGLYQTSQNITLTTPAVGATIYYTLNGAPPLTSGGTPSASALTYSGPITINKTSVLRTAATANGLSPTPVETHTYILLNIDGAATNGTDSAGLNTPFLEQTQPAGYGALASGTYNMNTTVSKSTVTSQGHGGISIAQAMLQGMREIPTVSIAMPKEDFAGGTGIYSNPTSEGLAWERACSAEFIPAAGDTRSDFQENCGLRVQGGASRTPAKSPKHSLSFRFRDEYGAGRLKQVLFPGSKVTNFNSIALRAGYNNTWYHSDSAQRTRASTIRDQWMRESLRDMGHDDAGDGFHVHLFINGLYWGLHNLAERQDNSHYAEYNGGDSNLIDARNGATFVEGTSAAWDAMRSTVSSGNWAAIKKVLDVDSYIDFQLLQRYGANQDLKVDGNWRAAGGGPFTTATDMRPWKLYSWDGERVLEDANSINVPLDPMNIRTQLEARPEYRRRFADRAQMHLTGSGALTPARCQERWAKYAANIDKAIIAESARWGGHLQSPPYSRSHWLVEQNRLYTSYFPVRSNNVINKLTTDGLYPTVAAPAFRINNSVSQGGYLAPGSTLTATGPVGSIYYTLDGSDPANEDGSINPNALVIASGVVSQPVFPFESAGWRYLAGTTALSDSNVVVGHGSYNNLDWKHPSFVDSTWTPGTGLMAGDTSTAINAATANTVIDIGPIGARYPTVYFRKSFNVTNAAAVTSIDLTFIRDDGFIAYLNGKEIFRENMNAGTMTYASFAAGNAIENDLPTTTYTLSPGDLPEGNNVLTVEVHNANIGSSDLGLDVSMNLTRPIGASSITLPQSARLTARSRVGNAWSPAITGTFLLEPAASSGNLAIAEINYHPREATLLEKLNALPLDLSNRDDFEFLELINTSGMALNLVDSGFAVGIDLRFNFRVVAPGERVLVVRNVDAFLKRYGNGLASAIVGTFSGGLNNDGETLTLTSESGAIIQSVTYNDAGAWPSRPDGSGSSLEIIDLNADANSPSNWASSVTYDGSPGVAGPLSDKRIVINEVSTNSTTDFIEIYNTTAAPIDISGWLLSDSKSVYRSFTFPSLTIGANSYYSFAAAEYDSPASIPVSNYSGTPGASPTTVTRNGHGLATGDLITIDGYGGFSAFNDSFEVTVVDPDTFTINATFLDNNALKGLFQKGRPFGLSASNGDDLWILATNASGSPVAFVDHVEFAAADPDRTLGRWLNGQGYDTLITMISNTKEAPNSGPLLGPVYLSEIHYAPAGSTDHEFVEISNQSAASIPLDQWRLRGGVDFNFTADHTLAPNSSVVIVSFDPVLQPALATTFRSTFGIDQSVALYGPMTDGPLNDTGGTVRLQRAGSALTFPQITIDEVRYLAAQPWPLASGASGNSLQRNPALTFGNFASSWKATTPTPGTTGGETYSSWAQTNNVGAGTDDPDGDDLPNLLEFAIGSDPNSKNELPHPGFANGNVTINFPVNLERRGVQVILETSVNLSTWSTSSTTVATSNGSIQTRQLQLSRLLNPRLYWRLRAIQMP